MLAIDQQQTITGITVYRDNLNPLQYYYLPSDKVKIADNGRKIHFVAYIDGEIKEGTDPHFTDDMKRTGGFLTLEVELGPEQNEIDKLRETLSGQAGRDIMLTQVPFKDGAVRLIMFGSSGNEANGAVDFSVAGSAKPSLMGKQTAVFSLRLGGMEAQVMWNLLKNGTQTQIGIVYDLDFLGLMPAYHLEITVDFKATEDFWQHHIDADFNLDSGSLKIVSNNDIDLITRNLVNTGAITVKAIDYSGDGSGTNPLGADDPNAMKLVRELMAPTLFDTTAIPREDYNVLNSTLPGGGIGTTTTPTSTATSPSSNTIPHPTPTLTANPVTPTATSSTTPTPPVTASTPTATDTVTPDINGTHTPPSNDGGNTPIPSPTPEPPPRTTPPPTPTSTATPTPTPVTPTLTGTATSTATPTPTGTTTLTTTPTPTTTQSPIPSTPQKVETKININAGYTLKHRSISEQVKRSYVFDKQEAKVHTYHPSGALSLQGTDFDVNTQVLLVRLGEGPFKEINIEIRSALDFEEFQIVEAIVHISYGFNGAKGDRTKRLHEGSYEVSPDKPKTFISLFVDQYGTLTYDYYVEFIHKAGSIIGTHETKIRSRNFVDVAERDIAVNISDHSPLIPVEIQPGNITFSDDGIQSTQVFVAPGKEGNGKTVIFKNGDVSLKKFLIAPATPDKYLYFKREKFFFREDEIDLEFENQLESQVIVNRPETRVLTISPILVNADKLISKAIVKVAFQNLDGEVLAKALVLNTDNPDVTQQTFSVIVEEDDPRVWTATTQFLLRNGTLMDGVEREYHIEQPVISLETCGLKVLKVTTLLEVDTFSANIAAIQVQVFANAGGAAAALETIMLKKSKPEDTVVLKGVDIADPLSAVVNVFKKDGSDQVLNYVVPAGLNELLLRITDI